MALTEWRQHSREDLYVELTPGSEMQALVAFGRRVDLPPVATSRANMLTPHDYQVHRLLRAIAENTTLSRLRADQCGPPSHWLMPVPTLERYFPHIPEALTNTRLIADQCYTDWDFKETIFPSFRHLSAKAAYRDVAEKTYEGRTLALWGFPEVVKQRIEKELTVIRDKGYADYFLVVDEIVRQAPRTCGRGSAAASIVSYCLGITHVDPIRHNLLFERFLNPGRHDPPDIDIDFPWDERPKILEWVFARYGAHQAAMVANQNTLAPRAAMREIAKVYGIPAVRDWQGAGLAPPTSGFRRRAARDDGQDMGRTRLRSLETQSAMAGDSVLVRASCKDISGIWVCILVAWSWSLTKSAAMCRSRSPPRACR